VNLDGTSLLVSLFISLIGFGLLVYGKRQGRAPHLVCGLALMVYPYFVPNVILEASIGLLLVALLMLAVRRGL